MGDAMYKILAAVVAASVFAGAAVMSPGLTETVEAHALKAGAKTDRLDLKSYGPACSQRGWPYYEADCLRNGTSATRDARQVRLVTTDRLSK